MSARPPVRVLIVDDSAVVRQMLAGALAPHPDLIVVGTARDPYEARERIVELEPDVITLDIEMPRMDGLTFLEQLMRSQPSRVIVVSSVAPASSANAMRALALGAVEIVAKPEDARAFADTARLLVRAIRAAAEVPRSRLAPAPHLAGAVRPPEAPIARPLATRLVAIGASTGGPRALTRVLEGCGPETPAIVVVQHMPARFTRALAERLDTIGALRVCEAEDGEPLRDGMAYVAPGDRHMRVRRDGARYLIQLKDGPAVHHQRPSVDVLFDSVAGCAGADAMGVLLTGMGVDGARGLLAMRELGARTIAQDEETSAVFGMPREAIELGAADQVLSLTEIARILASPSGALAEQN